MTGWRRRPLAFALALAATLSACAPAPPPPPPSVPPSPIGSAPAAPAAVPDVPGSVGRPRTAAEQRVGDEAYPQILARWGGAYEGEIATYVEAVGARLAAVTEQPAGPWTFTVLDTPVINAFATPGGYVYVTRGLVALAGDEAELAGVIGHEIAHVTAAHSAERATRATQAQIGLLATVIGAAVLGASGPVIDLLGQGAGALARGTVASFSREQELEADRLGVAYLERAGYAPSAQADFLRKMQAQAELSARLAGATYDPNRVDFFATHPATAERIRAAESAARGRRGGGRDRAEFLAALDGMIYGDSPRQGFVRGRDFLHPVLRFAFRAPEGFEITNSAAEVTMRGPRGASIVFDGGRDPGGSLERYVAREWAGALARQTRVGRPSLRPVRRIDGLPAASAVLPVRTGRGQALASLTAIRTGDGRLYRFLGLAATRQGLTAVEQAARSFRRLTPEEASRLRPWRVEVVETRPGDTLERLAARMPFERGAVERLRVLNGLTKGERLEDGRLIKLVVE